MSGVVVALDIGMHCSKTVTLMTKIIVRGNWNVSMLRR